MVTAILVLGTSLQASASEILSISLPTAIGTFEAGKPSLLSSERVFAADKAKDLFGHSLPKGEVQQFRLRRFGAPENKSAMVDVSVAYLPSAKHATLTAMIDMSGAQRAKWPEPGLPDMTKALGKRYGADQVWASTGKAGWSACFRVNRAVVRLGLLAPRPVAKNKAVPYSDKAIADWEAYVLKVVAKVKASPLNQ